MICVGAPEEPRLKLAREFGAEATVNIEEIKSPQDRIARVREIVGHFGADLVMDCSGHPAAGPEGIEMLRDGGTYVEMGQFTTLDRSRLPGTASAPRTSTSSAPGVLPATICRSASICSTAPATNTLG